MECDAQGQGTARPAGLLTLFGLRENCKIGGLNRKRPKAITPYFTTIEEGTYR